LIDEVIIKLALSGKDHSEVVKLEVGATLTSVKCGHLKAISKDSTIEVYY